MSGPNYEAHRADGGWRIMEVGQQPPGMFVDDLWLRANGFGPPSRMNIEDIVAAALYNTQNPLQKFEMKSMGHLPFPKQFAVDGLAKTRSGLVIAKR